MEIHKHAALGQQAMGGGPSASSNEKVRLSKLFLYCFYFVEYYFGVALYRRSFFKL
jgi:hypothetical protein